MQAVTRLPRSVRVVRGLAWQGGALFRSSCAHAALCTAKHAAVMTASAVWAWHVAGLLFNRLFNLLNKGDVCIL